MATTVSSFSAIDDTEVDAESPITESLMTRLRDNSYWIDPASTRTSATSNTLVLTPNHTAGTTQWQEINTIGGVNGTKGSFTSISNTFGTTITSSTSGILQIFTHLKTASSQDGSSSVIIDLSDDTFVGASVNDGSASNVYTGTLSGTGQIVAIPANTPIYMRRSSGNIQVGISGGTVSCHSVWVIL